MLRIILEVLQFSLLVLFLLDLFISLRQNLKEKYPDSSIIPTLGFFSKAS